jgi:hypothetical protein
VGTSKAGLVQSAYMAPATGAQWKKKKKEEEVQFVG